MNILNLWVDFIEDGRLFKKEGIYFEGVGIVKIEIDGEPLEENKLFQDALVYFDELEKSRLDTGNYLIFTCACGVAEDGGWEGVFVRVGEETVEWEMNAGGENIQYCFDRMQYQSEIDYVRSKIDAKKFPLAPGAVVFPEKFQR